LYVPPLAKLKIRPEGITKKPSKKKGVTITRVRAKKAHIETNKEKATVPIQVVRPEATPKNSLRLIPSEKSVAGPSGQRPPKRSRSPATDPRLGRPAFVPEESLQKIPKFAEKRRSSIEKLFEESSRHLQDPLLPTKERLALDAAVASILPDLSIEDQEVAEFNRRPVPQIPGRR
jgi:hypothetical protein